MSVDEADDRAKAAEEAAARAELRRSEAEAAEQVLRQQIARAQAVHEDIRTAHDSFVAQLRAMRVDAETRAGEARGVLAGEVPPGATTKDDLDVIISVSQAMHIDYVAEAERFATVMREEAERQSAECELQLAADMATAKRESDEMLAAVEAECARLRSGAETGRMHLIAEATGEHARLLAEGQAEASRLVQDAEERRTGILADLQARQGIVERRIADLDIDQRDYRQRLRTLISEQFAAVDTDEWDREIRALQG